jgi:lipopolysaccharide/colanic/teichoic acid biosynthesis glycosyltransferase
MKRLMDLILTIPAVIVFFIPCAIVAVILKFTGEGKIFYLQPRVGKQRQIFKMIKFATMLENSPNMASGDITTANDPRVLPMGKFLRKTKINELPQFINVLNGEMSLVGPRPFTPKIFDMFPEEFRIIMDQIPPGITGVGSIVFRDEESIIKNSPKNFMTCYKEDIIPKKIALEQWYLKNRSLTADFLILFLTVWCVLCPKTQLHYRLLKGLPQ